MICPNCHQRVDPKTSNRWLWYLINKTRDNKDHKPTAEEALKAVYMWDQSAMELDGHSILPTELRDFVYSAMSKEIL
jgi:hypothetical protein